MTQQDQTQKRSNSSGCCRGRPPGKKPTSESKIPKRGPGIAQLEKIRIENEQRNKVAVAKIPKRGPGIAQLEKIRRENEQRNKVAVAISPPPPPSPPRPSISYLPLPLPGFHRSNQPSSSSSVPLQNCSGGMSMNFPYESNSPSDWTPRTQQYQQPSSSMVNVPSENLAPPVDYYSKEPPSNQNKSSSFVVPMMLMPMDKMIILKSSRLYPLSKGVPPASSFNFKSNEITNYRNFGDDAPSDFRQVPSCSTTPSSSSEPNSMKNENLNGDFLSLAPPISPSEPKSTSTSPAAFHNQELPPPSQGTEEDQIPHGQQQRLHNFFPSKEEEEAQSVQTTETNKDRNCNGENGESMDLDLNL